METNNNTLNSWDAFTGSVLKPEDVRSREDVYVITRVSTEDQDGKAKLKLTLERNNVEKEFYCNATNTKTARQHAASPLQLVGKKITFDKMKVNNPSTGHIQDSLVINTVQ